MFEKEAEEYFETECLHSYADTEEQLKEDVVPAFQKGAEFGYNKAKEWHDINTAEPSKEQLGKQLLIRMESVTRDTDYDYLVYKYTGESITDVPGVLAWKEIE